MTKRKLLPSALTIAAALLIALAAAGCGSADEKAEPPEQAAQQTSPQAEYLAPAPEIGGALTDRNGAALEQGEYPELAGAEETFAGRLEKGETVSLTIDCQLQNRVKTILAEKLGDTGGAAVVVKVDTGEPLTIVSNGEGVNRALSSAYQPRELFLPCTVTAGLSENLISTAALIDCEGVFTRYEQEGIAPECWIRAKNYTHPQENATSALRDSCYYYCYSVGNDLGIDLLAEYAAAFGLGQPTGIELPESTGNMYDRKSANAKGQGWDIGNTLEAAAGRGEGAFTPLQYAQYCAALANGGARYSASILGSVSAADGELLYERSTEELSNILTGDTQKLMEELASFRAGYDEKLAAVQQGMYEALNSPYNAENRQIWEKSGIAAAGSAAAADGESLFMGYAPFEAPKFAVSVALDVNEGTALPQSIALEIFKACEQLQDNFE